jgi:uncharacterized protein with PIN domain
MSTDEGSQKFIVDHNVAKLSLWLRMMGYDTVVFDQPDDWQMIRIALAEQRIIITRDTGVMKRRVITGGQAKAIFMSSENPEEQIAQVINTFNLKSVKPFSRCLECNAVLIEVLPDTVHGLVPTYVFEIQKQFMQCPVCRQVYWRGTHWQKMLETIEKLTPGVRSNES